MNNKSSIEDDQEKLKYINENIIEKGYNPEDLNAFIINRRACSLQEITPEILKIEIEDFKNEKFKDTFTTIKKTMPLTKRDEQLNELYSSQVFQIKYLPLKQSILSEYQNEKKLNINISNGKLEKIGAIFSQIKYVCNISCKELKSNVRRTIDDFEWLRNQLVEKYPLIYIPPLYSKEKNLMEKPFLLTRYINKFFNAIMRRKLLGISPIIYQFLTLEEDKFNKYKDALTKNKFSLHFKMENFKSRKEGEEFHFNKPQIYLPEKYIKKIDFNMYNTLTDKLSEMLCEVAMDFKNLSEHTKELGSIFSKFYSNSTKSEFNDDVKNILAKFRFIFTNWSGAFEKQSLFFSYEMKEFFSYFNSELNEINNIYSQYIKFKEDYEKSGILLLEKKEKLFMEKKYNKWELSKEDKKKLDEFKNNYSEAMHYICKDYTELVEGQKIRVACSCNIIMREFKKVEKYFGEQFMNLFYKFKDLCEDKQKEKFDQKYFNY